MKYIFFEQVSTTVFFISYLFRTFGTDSNVGATKID